MHRIINRWNITITIPAIIDKPLEAAWRWVEEPSKCKQNAGHCRRYVSVSARVSVSISIAVDVSVSESASVYRFVSVRFDSGLKLI